MKSEFWLFNWLIWSADAVYNQSQLQAAAYICDGVVDQQTVYITWGGSGLDSFVGYNLIQELLYDQSCSFNSSCFTRYMSTILSTVLMASVGLLVCLLIIFLFALISPCFCSRSCRRWRGWKRLRERSVAGDFNLKIRRIMVGIVGVAVIVTLAVFGLIASQKQDVDSGLKSALCEIYKFLNQTLNGGEAVVFDTSLGYSLNAQFPGLYITSAIFQNITELVSPNSTLMGTMNTVMNESGIIEGELSLLQQWFAALNSNMQYNKANGLHTCIFCTNFSSNPSDTSQYNPTNPSMLETNNSLAGQLTVIRSQLKAFVTSGSDSVYNTMKRTASSLNSFIDQLTRVVYSNVLQNIDLIDRIMDYIDIGIIALLCLTVVPMGLLIFVLVKGLFISARGAGNYSDPHRPPMSPKFVMASIWITFVYTMIVFVFAGTILLGAYVLGSVCLIMEDAGSVAAKLSFRFGSASSSSVVVGITQQCLKQDTDGDILSAIVVSGEATARDKINSLTALSGQFSVIMDTVKRGDLSVNLTNNYFMSNLGRYIDQVGDLYLIKQDTRDTRVVTSSLYKPNSTAAIFSTDYTYGMDVYDELVFSVPQCEDRQVFRNDTPAGVIPFLTNYTFNDNNFTYLISGLSSFFQTLDALNVSVGVNTCPSLSAPSANLVPWGNLVSNKQSIISNKNFRCSTPNVTYVNATYTFVKQLTTKTCNQSEYRDYMHNFQSTVSHQSTRVDDSVAKYFDNIFGSAWNLIYGKLMEPIQQLSSAMNCQFISTRWNSLFRSMCITFTPSVIKLGNTFFILGFLGVLALLIEIVIWRHLKDNLCLWEDAVKNPDADHHIHARASGFANIRLSGLWHAWGSSLFGRNSSVVARSERQEVIEESNPNHIFANLDAGDGLEENDLNTKTNAN
jgi:hypothetical protein